MVLRLARTWSSSLREPQSEKAALPRPLWWKAMRLGSSEHEARRRWRRRTEICRQKLALCRTITSASERQQPPHFGMSPRWYGRISTVLIAIAAACGPAHAQTSERTFGLTPFAANLRGYIALGSETLQVSVFVGGPNIRGVFVELSGDAGGHWVRAALAPDSTARSVYQGSASIESASALLVRICVVSSEGEESYRTPADGLILVVTSEEWASNARLQPNSLTSLAFAERLTAALSALSRDSTAAAMMHVRSFDPEIRRLAARRLVDRQADLARVAKEPLPVRVVSRLDSLPCDSRKCWIHVLRLNR